MDKIQCDCGNDKFIVTREYYIKRSQLTEGRLYYKCSNCNRYHTVQQMERLRRDN